MDGNYGVVTGVGRLIILDFDSQDYYAKVCPLLPATFTVQTASRKLLHFYYYLKGEMFKTVHLRDEKKASLLDIMASNGQAVCPNSKLYSNEYKVMNNIEIKEIRIEDLLSIFRFSLQHQRRFIGSFTELPVEVEKVVRILTTLGIKRTSLCHWQCPFHPMNGKGNLSIAPNGSLHCFHEDKHWRCVLDFLEDYANFKGMKNLTEIKGIEDIRKIYGLNGV